MRNALFFTLNFGVNTLDYTKCGSNATMIA